MSLSKQIRTAMEAAQAEPALAFDARWRPWAWLLRVADSMDELLIQAGLDAGTPVALVARNRPQHVAAMAGLMLTRRTTCMVYSAQTAGGVAADLLRLRAPAVLADEEDWTPEAREACRTLGCLGLMLRDDENAPVLVAAGLDSVNGHDFKAATPEIAFELLSSGTTGPPKRLPLSWSALESAVADAGVSYAGSGHRDAPVLMVHPLGNVAGVAYLAPALAQAQPIVLLEKFSVAAWVDAVRQHRPVRAALPPAAVRMVLEADPDREDLASLSLVAVGGARIDPDLQDRFEQRYGVPVLTAFGATEFGGVVANWSLDLYRAFGGAKRGSAGRPSRGVELRIVNPAADDVLPPGEVGLLEAKVGRIGPHWIRTNDLASIDADGFLFLHGRADDAINRGGFKIVPETVVQALRQHPAVADAAVVGILDDRLGEVPVAAVELKPNATVPDEAELIQHARERLLAYQVPVKVRIVAALPRNPSMKVSVPDVRRLFTSSDP